MTYTVYGATVSPFVRKVCVALAEKKLPYEFKAVNPTSPPEGWRNLSPLGKIPAFTDGERSLADSSVICAYLERRNPEPALYPRDDYDYARALWFEEYADSVLAPQLISPSFVPLVLGAVLFGRPPTRATRVEAEQAIAKAAPPLWDYLEAQLGDCARRGSEYLAGDRFSIADIAVAGVHVNLRFAGFEPDAGRHPRLRGFLERVFARPSFAKLIANDAPVWDRRAVIAAL